MPLFTMTTLTFKKWDTNEDLHRLDFALHPKGNSTRTQKESNKKPEYLSHLFRSLFCWLALPPTMSVTTLSSRCVYLDLHTCPHCTDSHICTHAHTLALRRDNLVIARPDSMLDKRQQKVKFIIVIIFLYANSITENIYPDYLRCNMFESGSDSV